jgi:hypothetical protein
MPKGRRTRGGKVIAGTAVAMALAACSSASLYGGPPDDGGGDELPVTADAAYGGWPYDAPYYDTGVDAGKEAASDAPSESGPTDAGDGG